MNDFQPSYFFDLNPFAYPELFADCQYVWEAIQKLPSFFENYASYEIRTEIPTGAHIVNPESIFIGKGTIIEPGAYIRGPCVIGSHCIIRHGAYIRGSFVCGDHCVIGHDTEIKTAIFLNHVHAAHFAYVGDCILGNRVNLGAGTKCANLRFDHQPIVIQDSHQEIETGLKKLGAMMGDGSQTGCNAVVLPGTCIGREVQINAGVTIGGNIPSYHFVASPAKPLIRKCK